MKPKKVPSPPDPMFNAVSADFGKCADQLDSEDTQFWRRTLCRTLFSMFEALNGLLREKALQAICSKKKNVNITRIQLLGGNEWRILETGKLEKQPLRRPFLNYTAFILRTLAEESGTEPVFFSDDGWKEFQNAIKIRHRLTHPAKNTDMNISDAELATLRKAVRWYGNAVCIAMGNDKFWSGSPMPKPLPPFESFRPRA